MHKRLRIFTAAGVAELLPGTTIVVVINGRGPPSNVNDMGILSTINVRKYIYDGRYDTRPVRFVQYERSGAAPFVILIS